MIINHGITKSPFFLIAQPNNGQPTGAMVRALRSMRMLERLKAPTYLYINSVKNLTHEIYFNALNFRLHAGNKASRSY